MRAYIEAVYDADAPQNIVVVTSRHKTPDECEINTRGIAETAAEAVCEEWAGPDGGGDPDGGDYDNEAFVAVIQRAIDNYIGALKIYQCEEVSRTTLTHAPCVLKYQPRSTVC